MVQTRCKDQQWKNTNNPHVKSPDLCLGKKKQSQWGTNKQISMHTKPKTSLFMVTSQCHIALNQIIPNSVIS